MQWQSQTQQNSVYKLHMISKLSASSCWGFLQVILFWRSHPSAGKIGVIGLQLALHCNPSFRSTIVKRYLCFWKTNKQKNTFFKLFFFNSLILGNWIPVLLPLERALNTYSPIGSLNSSSQLNLKNRVVGFLLFCFVVLLLLGFCGFLT